MTQDQEDEQGLPPLPKGWDRCHAYLERKRRFCRQAQIKGSKYCGNHQQLAERYHGKQIRNQDFCRLRIPCPVDPSHLIFEDQVDKHIKICPKVTRAKAQEDQPFFQRDVNSGGHGSLGFITDKRKLGPPMGTLEWAQSVARRVLEIHTRLFDGGEKPIESLSVRDIHNALELKDYAEPELKAGLAEAVERYRIKSGGLHHLRQQASLIGHLRATNLLPESTGITTSRDNAGTEIHFLEMGAGRGILGLLASGVAAATQSNVRLTMVERSGTRSKADKILRVANKGSADVGSRPAGSIYLRLNTLKWNRIQCDLAHVHIPTILEQPIEQVESAGDKRKAKDERVIAVVAKHLCGAGTDLALKSLQESGVDVCVMATCCHGVCSWKDYVGRDFLIDAFGNSFGLGEFDLLRKWSAATVAASDGTGSTTDGDHTAGMRKDDSASDDPCTLSDVVRSLNLKCGIQGLGRACQRLIDAGRCDYMKKKLFPGGSHEVNLYHYIEPDVTPQNAVLVASRILSTAR